jgi:RNA chaperone ProQ/FINO-like protein
MIVQRQFSPPKGQSTKLSRRNATRPSAVNPMKLKPVLKLKLTSGSSMPKPPEPVAVPKPPPPPKPLPAEEPVIAEKLSKTAAHRIAVATTRRILVLRFPAAFKSLGSPKLPLRIGVREDILAQAPDLDPRLVAAAMRQYIYGFDYRRYLMEGAIRVDLNGEPAGVVTADQARFAASRTKGKERKSEEDREDRKAAP